MHIARSRPAHVIVLATLSAALIAGCGRKNGNAATSDTGVAPSDSTAVAPAPAPAATTAATTPSSGTNSAASSLTADDIDRWQHGMDAELKAVQDAGVQLRNAKTATDSMNAVLAANETSTRPIGARAAGVTEQQYQLLSSTLSSLVANMTPVEQEMDASKMSAAAVAMLNQSREKALTSASVGMPPELLAALRPRAAVLRKQALTLAGERLKAAGMTG
jgi:hypothetical protein